MGSELPSNRRGCLIGQSFSPWEDPMYLKLGSPHQGRCTGLLQGCRWPHALPAKVGGGSCWMALLPTAWKVEEERKEVRREEREG